MGVWDTKAGRYAMLEAMASSEKTAQEIASALGLEAREVEVVLEELAAAGLVKKEGKGPRRVAYSLTEKGQRQLGEWRREVREVLERAAELRRKGEVKEADRVLAPIAHVLPHLLRLNVVDKALYTAALGEGPEEAGGAPQRTSTEPRTPSSTKKPEPPQQGADGEAGEESGGDTLDKGRRDSREVHRPGLAQIMAMILGDMSVMAGLLNTRYIIRKGEAWILRVTDTSDAVRYSILLGKPDSTYVSSRFLLTESGIKPVIFLKWKADRIDPVLDVLVDRVDIDEVIRKIDRNIKDSKRAKLYKEIYDDPRRGLEELKKILRELKERYRGNYNLIKAFLLWAYAVVANEREFHRFLLTTVWGDENVVRYRLIGVAVGPMKDEEKYGMAMSERHRAALALTAFLEHGYKPTVAARGRVFKIKLADIEAIRASQMIVKYAGDLLNTR